MREKKKEKMISAIYTLFHSITLIYSISFLLNCFIMYNHHILKSLIKFYLIYYFINNFYTENLILFVIRLKIIAL